MIRTELKKNIREYVYYLNSAKAFTEDELVDQILALIESKIEAIIGPDLPLDQPFDDKMDRIELAGKRVFRKAVNWSKAEQRARAKSLGVG